MFLFIRGASRDRLHRDRSGFSLLELLIVIAIVLILTAIALPNFTAAQIRAGLARSAQDVRSISIGLQTYVLDWKIYPIDHHGNWPAERLDQGGYTMLTSPVAYLSGLPSDPFGSHETNDPRLQGVRASYYGGSGSDNPACMGSFHNGGGNDSQCVHGFLVFGIGPDKRRTTMGWEHFPSGNPYFGYPVTVTSYSPTNGIRSQGDVHRMVGEWKHGFVTIDR